MVEVEVEVWVKVFAVEVGVEVEWKDDFLKESPEWLVEKFFVAETVLPLHHHLKEVQLMDYSLVLILRNF